MRVGNLSKAFAIAATLVWVAGCSSTSTTSESGETMDSADKSSAMQGSAASSGASGGSGMSGSSMASGQNGMMDQSAVSNLATVFYFDFDKATVRAEFFGDLSAHAKYLASNPSARVVLEGHADERGTREYNMALGERRAKAVSRYLTVQGVAASQIETVSYGEERPAEVGHSDMAWGKNRRVELKYDR